MDGDEDRGREGLPPQRRVIARDGTPLVIRPLLPTDREELAAAYDHLSEQSRRRRFFAPPSRLSSSVLDYLTDLDFDRRFALVAELADDTRPPGCRSRPLGPRSDGPDQGGGCDYRR